MLLGLCAVIPAAAQAPQGQAPPAAGRGRGAPAPATRIVTFEAQPATIKPGESALLVWHIENPPSATGFNGFGTIEPGVGRVAPRGSKTCHAGRDNDLHVDRRRIDEDGDCDSSRHEARHGGCRRVRECQHRHPAHAGWQAGLLWHLRVGEPVRRRAAAARRPALKPGAEKYRVSRGPLDTGATSDCLPLIPPNSFGVPYEFQFIQNKEYLVILHEYPNTFRIIPLDGEPHQADPDPSWLGDSVGRWEGDTLVIDTIGYNDKTEINGYRHSEDLHTVERLTRVPEGVEYELTIEDPNVFAAPWKVNRSFRFVDAPQKRIFEFICENNRDYRPLFGDKK